MKEKQYVVCLEKEGKPFLARVISINKDTIEVLPQKDVQYERRSVTLKPKEIMLNLGLNPHPGTVYGCDTAVLHRKTVHHDFWGAVHFMYVPSEEDMKLLKRALDNTARIIEKMRLQEFVPLMETEIRAKKGKYAGMYMHSRKDNRPNVVWYAPEAAAGKLGEMEYVILHEFGHVVRFNGVRNLKYRSRWLKLFQKSIANVQVDAKSLSRMLKGLEDEAPTQSTFGEAFKAVTEDDGPRVQKAVLDWLKQTHKIHGRELEILWQSDNVDAIKDLWPDHMIDTHDLKPMVTEYATKNYEELFAESFAFTAQGKKLPKVVEELMEKTLTRARQEVKNTDGKDQLVGRKNKREEMENEE